MSEEMPEQIEPIKNIDELKEFISNCQQGLLKGYSHKDLLRFAIDERLFIQSGNDIARDYMSLLPQMLSERKKLEVFKREIPEKESFEMQISCYVFSGQEIRAIFDFLDTLPRLVETILAGESKN